MVDATFNQSPACGVKLSARHCIPLSINSNISTPFRRPFSARFGLVRCDRLHGPVKAQFQSTNKSA